MGCDYVMRIATFTTHNNQHGTTDVYSRVPSKRVAMVSRKVFCGANSPLRPGILAPVAGLQAASEDTPPTTTTTTVGHRQRRFYDTRAKCTIVITPSCHHLLPAGSGYSAIRHRGNGAVDGRSASRNN